MYDSQTGFEFKTGTDYADRSIAVFRLEAVEQPFLSREAGKPVFKDVEKITIITPGNNKSEWSGFVTDEHRTKYATAYQAFKQGQPAPVEGTPIEHWPPLSPAQVKNLQASNIRTVEQLANLNDAGLAEIGMGARTLRENAKNWLADAADGKPLLAALAAKEELEKRLAVQDDTIKQLQSAIMGLQAQMEGRPQMNEAAMRARMQAQQLSPSPLNTVAAEAMDRGHDEPEPAPIRRAYRRKE